MEPSSNTRRAFYRKKISYKRRTILFLWATCIAYFSLVSGQSTDSGLISDYDYDSGNSGDLVEGVNCTPAAITDFPRDLFTQKQRSQGAVAVHFLVSLYIFYCVALVCDDFFVPSIECICEDLHLPSDVGGATFMAIATSAPELFTNVIGTFVTKGDIGIGTIVGSAVFNILAIGACCGLAAREPLGLEWWPLTRDCFFYAISVILLIVVLLNRQVYWYEALILVLFYFVYIGVMYKNTPLKEAAETFVDECLHGRKRRAAERNALSIRGVTPPSTPNPNPKQNTETTPLLRSGEEGVSDNSEPRGYSEEGEADENEEYNAKRRRLSVVEHDELLISHALQKSVAHAKEEEEEGGLFILPRGAGAIEWFEWIVGWPIRLCLTLTMPDCRQRRWRRWYPVTFIMCMLWIGSLSYVVSWMMTVIGHTFHIPDSVMGLTFIAAGTSVPEAVSSIIVSRQGLGGMGISNSIGSNTFDILICLGVPWLIRASLISNDPVENYVQINSTGFGYSTAMLMISLFLLYLILACNRFVLDKKVGITALVIYAVFLIVASLIELNVLFPKVNLPTCPSDW